MNMLSFEVEMRRVALNFKCINERQPRKKFLRPTLGNVATDAADTQLS